MLLAIRTLLAEDGPFTELFNYSDSTSQQILCSDYREKMAGRLIASGVVQNSHSTKRPTNYRQILRGIVYSLDFTTR